MFQINVFCHDKTQNAKWLHLGRYKVNFSRSLTTEQSSSVSEFSTTDRDSDSVEKMMNWLHWAWKEQFTPNYHTVGHKRDKCSVLTTRPWNDTLKWKVTQCADVWKDEKM